MIGLRSGRLVIERATAAYDGDGVLEPELGDDQILGQVLTVDVLDAADQLGHRQDVGQLVERLGEIVLRRQQRVVSDGFV